MIVLERYDIRKLEDYIQNIAQYKKQLRFREYELLESHEMDNPEGGKSNLPGNPVEREVIKKTKDKKYNNLANIVNGVDRLMDELNDDDMEMIRLRYWDCPIDCNQWDQIADRFYVSKTTILRRRNAMLTKLANYIGYVQERTLPLCKSTPYRFIMVVQAFAYKGLIAHVLKAHAINPWHT